ncbi:hypothetical protein [Tenuifilum sp.]|uniref:hypothetical protein n=1 Tax=Tenuifilum sp. TaxID=2760880 RepID=UPI001B7CA55C|nr:hypothetical protein [Bacteroidales bacterium]HOK60273.1 hypothetical protein [Tenuifilum sp.]HOK85279.1 hypothetical protein [Tenuifilum sp.]HON70061.1 hypothetical protein [Tenuifilum sp.]HOU73610.1 hypothetical protein [Tenuifilum sp.]
MHKGSKRILLLSAMAAMAVLTISCKCNRESEQMLQVSEEQGAADSALVSSIESVKQIFYSLPSPLETAMILKRSGATYNEELLNPIENASKYNTTKSMALNLGIYSTDLSYASLFDQTQATIKYMTVSKKMAEGLGILNAIDNSVIEKLEENINNRDVILETISETFLNTNSILEEDDRVAVGSIILVGGWIEGLYIATSLVEDINKVDNEMVDRIIDQKLSLQTVLKLLEQSNSNADVRELYSDMLELEKVYNDVKITVSDVKVIQDGKSKVATLKSKNVTTVSPEAFKKLKTKVIELRNKYTA